MFVTACHRAGHPGGSPSQLGITGLVVSQSSWCDMNTAWKKHGRRMAAQMRTQIIGNNFMCCQFDRERAPATSRPFESNGWWLVGRSSAGTEAHLDHRVKRSRTTELQTTGHKWTYCDERIVTGYHLRKVWSGFTGKREVPTVCVFQPINIGGWNHSSPRRGWLREEPAKETWNMHLERNWGVVLQNAGYPGYASSSLNRT